MTAPLTHPVFKLFSGFQASFVLGGGGLGGGGLLTVVLLVWLVRLQRPFEFMSNPRPLNPNLNSFASRPLTALNKVASYTTMKPSIYVYIHIYAYQKKACTLTDNYMQRYTETYAPTDKPTHAKHCSPCIRLSSSSSL